MTDPAAPPLRVWGYACLLSVLVFAVLAVSGPPLVALAVRLRATHDEMNLARLAKPAEGRPRVVALGASKLFFATDYDERLVDGRYGVSPDALVFNRLTWLDARYADIEPALRQLQLHPPRMLLFETDLLLLDREARVPVRDNIRRVLNLLPAPAPASGSAAADDNADDNNVEQNRGHDVFKSPEYCLRSKGAEMVQRYASLAATWHINSAARQAAYLQYLRALQAAGTQVVLLQLPRSAAAEAVLPVRLKQQWQRALEQISAAEKFQLWQPPRPPEDEYCDQGHLTQDGRARFSRWLAQQLAAELQAVR